MVASTWSTVTRPRIEDNTSSTLCFFVFCNRHWLNRGPGKWHEINGLRLACPSLYTQYTGKPPPPKGSALL